MLSVLFREGLGRGVRVSELELKLETARAFGLLRIAF